MLRREADVLRGKAKKQTRRFTHMRPILQRRYSFIEVTKVFVYEMQSPGEAFGGLGCLRARRCS